MKLKTTLVFAVATALSSAQFASAAYTFTTLGSPVTETFTDYLGTAAPANFTIAVTAPPSAIYKGQNNGSVNANGVYAYGSSIAGTTDFSLGFLASTNNTTSATAAAGFLNSTGSTIDTLSISYDGEQWRNGGRPSSFSVSYSIDGGAATTIPALFYAAPNTTGGTNGATGSGTGTPLTTSLGGLSVAPGSTVTLTWTYSGIGDNTGSGARAGISIDNISVIPSAVPEPTSLALLGLGAIATLRRRRRA